MWQQSHHPLASLLLNFCTNHLLPQKLIMISYEIYIKQFGTIKFSASLSIIPVILSAASVTMTMTITHLLFIEVANAGITPCYEYYLKALTYKVKRGGRMANILKKRQQPSTTNFGNVVDQIFQNNLSRFFLMILFWKIRWRYRSQQSAR